MEKYEHRGEIYICNLGGKNPICQKASEKIYIKYIDTSHTFGKFEEHVKFCTDSINNYCPYKKGKDIIIERFIN